VCRASPPDKSQKDTYLIRPCPLRHPLASSTPPLLQAPSIGREDSLAELEHSFNRQVLSGEITADIIEEEPRAPSLGREDSLAQLESSFKKQVNCF